jgi:hypothetical protein
VSRRRRLGAPKAFQIGSVVLRSVTASLQHLQAASRLAHYDNVPFLRSDRKPFGPFLPFWRPHCSRSPFRCPAHGTRTQGHRGRIGRRTELALLFLSSDLTLHSIIRSLTLAIHQSNLLPFLSVCIYTSFHIGNCFPTTAPAGSLLQPPFFIFIMAVAQNPADPFDRLPDELILQIVEQPCLSVRDLISLARTSHRHYRILISIAYEAHVRCHYGCASK